MKNIVLILAAILILSSCTKEDPKPDKPTIQALAKAHKVN